MSTATRPALDADYRRRFDQEGYIILKGILEPGVVAGVIGEMNKLVDQLAATQIAAGKARDPLTREPFERRLVKLYEGHLPDAPHLFRQELHLAGMFDLFFHPRLLDVVELFLGPELRLYPNYSVRPKLPEDDKTRVLWHQDGGYTEATQQHSSTASGEKLPGVDDLRMLNIWTPLVPARVANGCMQFIPGTHKFGSVPHVKKQFYLEIVPEHLEPHLPRAVNIELDPGDVVLFHNLLYHMGLPNTAGTVRWSCDWRYQDATQPTLRPQTGHIARSRSNPGAAVKSAAQWAALSFV